MMDLFDENIFLEPPWVPLSTEFYSTDIMTTNTSIQYSDSMLDGLRNPTDREANQLYHHDDIQTSSRLSSDNSLGHFDKTASSTNSNENGIGYTRDFHGTITPVYTQLLPPTPPGESSDAERFQAYSEGPVRLPSCSDSQDSLSKSGNRSSTGTAETEKDETGEKSVNSRLPPCRICGDTASGFHYGVNTCEACKGFFRRALKRTSSFICPRNQDCDVKGERRNLCGYCRYTKCLQQGMSKEAIKTGRYTHEKRTKDILEVLMLKEEEEKKRKEAEKTEKEKRLLAESGMILIGSRGEDLQEITKIILGVHNEMIISTTNTSMEYINERTKYHGEQFKLKQEMFGSLTSLSREEHSEILRTTGLDVDNRKEALVFHCVSVERWIKKWVKFAKRIPGFNDLCSSDQLALLKDSRVEFWFLGAYRGFNQQFDTVVMPNGRCLHKEEMMKIFTRGYIDLMFDLSARLKRKEFTTEEIIMLKCVSMVSSDRNPIKDKEKVNNIEGLMLYVLYHVIQKNRSCDQWNLWLGRAFDALTMLRDLSNYYQGNYYQSEAAHWYKESALLREMISDEHYEWGITPQIS